MILKQPWAQKHCSERFKMALFRFLQVLIDEVKTTYWESEAKSQKLFKLKFSHQKFLRKWFRSYLELKNKCSECFKMAFFSFLQVLIDEEETAYWKSKECPKKSLK